ncbi:MAG: DUF4292 domain-containing protein [Desulfatirhabdiaceae bacterium]
METKRTAIQLVFVSMIFLTLPSCSGLLSNLPGQSYPVAFQPDSPEITHILMDLQSRNWNIHSMKGIGRIKIWNSDQTQTARTAWTVVRPDKIRILIMAITGFPVASLAADGEWVYLMSHNDNRFYRKQTTDANLEQMLNLPIQSRELIGIASGGIPIRNHMASSLIEDLNKNGIILTLIGRYGKPSEILFLNSDPNEPYRIEFFDDDGNLEYRVIYEERKEVDGYQIPFRMILNNDEDVGIQLDMEKIWIDPPVSEDIFILSPP